VSGERSALLSRPLIALLTAEGISSLGSQMTFLALPWFVLVTTGSAAKMSIVLAVEILPIALLGIPSGALVAKLGACTTMVLGDAGRAPLMLAIPLLQEAGLLSFPLLLVCVFALGCFIAPYFSAQRLILPELVGDDERTVGQANAIVEGTQRATALLGPTVAGILIAVIGASSRWQCWPARSGCSSSGRSSPRGGRGRCCCSSRWASSWPRCRSRSSPCAAAVGRHRFWPKPLEPAKSRLLSVLTG